LPAALDNQLAHRPDLFNKRLGDLAAFFFLLLESLFLEFLALTAHLSSFWMKMLLKL